MELVGTLLVALVMSVGLLLAVLPFAPGLVVIWAAAIAYGIGTGFDGVAWVALAIITVLGLGGFAATMALPNYGGARRGAATSSLVAGAVGAIVGAWVLPVLGFPIGAIVGIHFGEWRRLGDADAAWGATIGALRGFGIAALVDMIAGALMVMVWLGWVLVRALG